MLKPHNHPDAELNRVRGVLHSLIDNEAVAKQAKEALMIAQRGARCAMYRYLYEVAEQFNPYPRDEFKWRKRCMQTAFSSRPTHTSQDTVRRCRIAATFYLLSEGLYSMPRLPDLT